MVRLININLTVLIGSKTAELLAADELVGKLRGEAAWPPMTWLEGQA